jgi:TolA-binding protein
MKKSKILRPLTILSVICLSSGIDAGSREIRNDQKQLFVDDQIKFASGLAERHYYSAAADELKRLINKFPDDPVVAEAYLTLGETYAKQKQFDNAEKAFEAFFSKFPKIRIYKSARLRYAVALLSASDRKYKSKAIDILTDLINDKTAPSVVREAAVYHLGRTLAELGRKKEAVKILSMTAYSKAENESDKFKAFAALELAGLISPEKGAELLLPLTETVSLPSYILTPVTWKLAGIYKETKQYRKAAELYAKCSVLFTSEEAGKEALYKRLESLFLAGDYQSVISESNKILTSDKDTENELIQKISYIKALALVKKNFHKQALGIFRSVFSKTVDSDLKAKSLYSLIESLSVLNKHKTAAEMLSKLISSSSLPGDITAEPLLYLIKHSKNSTEFLPMLNRLIAKKGLSRKNLNLLILKKADILEKAGKLKDAEEEIKKILSGGENTITPYALYKSASILAKKGKKSEALEQCRIILKKYNKSSVYPAALLKTGILLLEDKKTEKEAAVYFKQLITKFRNLPEAETASFYIAYIDFINNNYSKAEKLFEKLFKNLKSSEDRSLSINTGIYLVWTYIRQNKREKIIEFIKKAGTDFLLGSPESFLQDFSDYLKKTNPELAEKALMRLLKSKNPVTRQNALIKLAELQISENSKEAEKNIKKALELDADEKLTQLARFKLAELLMNTGKKEEAVLLFEKCLENPTDKAVAAKSRLGLAKLLASDKDRLKTANRYAMSVFILSKDPETASEAMLLSIRLSIKLKNKKEAESTFKELESRFPKIAESSEAQQLKKEISLLPDKSE